MAGKFYEVFMNEQDPSALSFVATAKTESLPPPAGQKPLRYWLKKLFACNPFYLGSAALLLYGCYRVLIDAPFLDLELSRLWFSYSSVSLYELLLVVTAIFLARRQLTYDSTLLFSVENLLVFVPFMLISQAAFIDLPMARAMSLAAAVLAVVRFRALKRCVLDLPGRLFGAVLILLILNMALPLLYRHFGNTKIGIHLDSGPAYVMNEATWLLILPLTLALANFLPWAGRPERRQRHWLPAGLFALWFAATVTHVYCLDYIYEFDLRPELFAPGLWVFTWTFLLYLPTGSAFWIRGLRTGAIILPLLSPLLAAQGIQHTYLILAALNIVAYAIVYTVGSNRDIHRHLLFAALLMFAAGLPLRWVNAVVPHINISDCVIGGIIAYIILLIVCSRNPRLGVLGGFLLGWTLTSVLSSRPDDLYWAFQGGFIFILLHSLRWEDAKHSGAKSVRHVMSVLWVAETFVWMSVGSGSAWMPCLPGVPVLVVYAIAQIRASQWQYPGIPAAAILVILSGPGIVAANHIFSLPAGLLAVIGSFLLFGLGTAAALTRSYWHKSEPALPSGPVKTEPIDPPAPPAPTVNQ